MSQKKEKDHGGENSVKQKGNKDQANQYPSTIFNGIIFIL